jgi:ribosome-associated protein
MSRPLVINSEIQISAAEIQLSFARSAGPGGQNVNKVNSKAVLRWNIANSNALPAGAKKRFQEQFPTRINQAGEVVLASDQHREQLRNVSECYEKLRNLILSILVAPRPRVKTRPSHGSIERRLQGKRVKSKRKQMRRYRPGSDD